MAGHVGTGVMLGVLGPTSLDVDGRRVALRPRERALLATLAVHEGNPVAADRLLEALWGERPPASGRKVLHNHVARLRRAAGDRVVASTAGGYALHDGVVLDTVRFRELVRHARLSGAVLQHRRQVEQLRAALALWRGEPFADAGDSAAAAAAAHLHEERRQAEEDLATAKLAAGDDRALPLLERLAAEEPFREHRWRLLVVARYRAGRRRDAALALVDARRHLAGVGLTPSPELVELDRLVAADDPRLHTAEVLGGPPAPPVRVEPVAVPVVGREAELARIAGLLAGDGPAAGGGRRRAPAVLVVGETGVGKTTLLREVARRAAEAGTTVAGGGCREADRIPLAPFVRVLEALVAADREALAEAAGGAAGLLGALSPALRDQLGASTGEVERGRPRLFDAVAGVLARLAERRPLLVVLDDVHLAPPTTRRLIHHLVTAGDGPAVVATSATDPAEGVPWTVVELGGLDEAAVAAYLAHTLGGDVDPGVPAWVAAQTGGNALFVAEVTGDLVRRGALRRSGGRWVLAPGEEDASALRQLLVARLDGLTDDVRATLEAAAVLGPRFRAGDLRAMVGPADAQLAAAVQAGVVVPGPDGDAFWFRHPLLHAAVLDGIGPGLALELHEAAAAAIEGSPTARAGELAHHHLAAAPLAPGRAVASARAAAVEAMAAHAHSEAAELWRAAHRLAVDVLGDDRLACELAIGWGSALRQAGDPANVEVLLGAAEEAERLDDGELLARAVLLLCRLGATSVAGAVEHRVAEKVDAALARPIDPALRAELAAAATMLHSMAGDPALCRRLFDEALATARRLGDPRLLAEVLPFAYLAVGGPADLDLRAALAGELLRLARRLRDPEAAWEGSHLRFSVRLQRGDPRLRDDLRRMVELSEEVREPERGWELACADAAVLHLSGDLEGAERRIGDSLAAAGSVAESRVLAAWSIQVFAVRADQGRLGELAGTVEELAGAQPGMPAWRAVLAYAAAQAGERDLARRALATLAESGFDGLPVDYTWTGAMTCLAHAAGCAGDGELARLVHGRLAPCAGRLSWVGTCTLGPIDTALAAAARAMGDERAAARHARTAVRLAARLRAPRFLAAAEAVLR